MILDEIIHSILRMTLYAVIEHLSAIAALSSDNNMTAHNLSIVMGPCLTASQADVMMENVSDMVTKQNDIIAFLITNCNKIELTRPK